MRTGRLGVVGALLALWGVGSSMSEGKSAGSMFSAVELRRVLETFVGDRSPTRGRLLHDRTADLIARTFRRHGWDVREQPFVRNGIPGKNIVGRKPGTVAPGRVWAMGAHYDTEVGTPGADDNGVAVAGVLEAARLLAGRTFQDSVELVAWDQEEGGLGGSTHMAEAARKSGLNLQGVIALEMIGCRKTSPGSQKFPVGLSVVCPDLVAWCEQRGMRGDFIAVLDQAPDSALSDAVRWASGLTGLPVGHVAVKGAAAAVPHFYRSDHAPFWRAGYSALFVTDTAEFRSDRYHSPRDTIDHVDYEFAAQVMSTVTLALMRAAGCNGS